MTVYLHQFPVDDASDWPGWTPAPWSPFLVGGCTADLAVASGIGRADLTWPNAGSGMFSNSSEVLAIGEDLSLVSAWKLTSKFRSPLALTTNQWGIFMVAGDYEQSDGYFSSGLNLFDDGLYLRNLQLYDSANDGTFNEDLVVWDPAVFYFMECQRASDGTLEFRLWKEADDRPTVADVTWADTGTGVINGNMISVQMFVAPQDGGAGGSGSVEFDYVRFETNPTEVVETSEKQILFYVGHVEMGDDMEWDMTTEEVLGGTGRATATVQSRDRTWEPAEHDDVKVVIATGPLAGWVLWRGEIIQPPLELPIGVDVWKWKLDCADYNAEFDWRLVGALDGKTWFDTSGLGIYVNIDPFASSLKTDKLTVQQLLDHFIRVDGEAFETTTFVNQYLPDFLTLTWNYSKLRTALEELAAYVVGNLQWWADPDLKFHWVTIPAWQELAQDLVAQSLDPNTSLSPLMFAQGSIQGLAYAPFNISDDPDEAGAIGARQLKINPDGSDMPEQVYVRGGTGYVYNAAPIPSVDETKTVVSEPVVGQEGTYQLFITENSTKLWHVDSTGYVSTIYNYGYISGPWPVKWVSVPWSATRNKGGNYWKFLTGQYAGLLADDNTNYLNLYGGIRVEFIASITAGTAQIGTGGSGWVNEVTQDPGKRQAYLNAPISVTKALRDSFGGQALYRGQYPTLRGSLIVSQQNDGSPADGWRAGQLMKITDARLPAAYNSKYFIIQRVRARLFPFVALREYALDFGDGPTSRYSYKSSKPFGADWPPPANQIVVGAHDLSPGPNSTQIITGQLVNGAGQPWNIAGKVVEWSFQCYNSSGVLLSGEGSIAPTVSITDTNGTARTKLTSGPDTNVVYYVFARVRAV